MKTKTVALCLAFLLMISVIPLKALAQTTKAESYTANLILKKDTRVEMKSVLIAPENGILSINGTKDRTISKSFPYANIKNAGYAYSDKPQIKEAILLGVLTNGVFGAQLLFNKTKKHWLVLDTETEIVYLELQQNNYRRLLYDLNANGIKIIDSGDRDSKEQPRPKAPALFTEETSCRDDFNLNQFFNEY